MMDQREEKDYILVEGEDMEISIVRTDSNSPATPATSPFRHSRRWWIAVGLLTLAVVALTSALGWILYRRFADIGVPISRSPQENIAILRENATAPQPTKALGVSLSSDSVLGVAMDFYCVDGLSAALENTEPTVADTSVCLYVRSADYLADGTLIGTTVVEGQEQKSTRDRRIGYVAMADNELTIGVARSNDVKDYVQTRGGSFFRQFILVSNGVLPSRFFLHGKVERRALGRIGDHLYVVCTRNKETMWDFADALREYGFIDAIYITGGNDLTFYRDANGTAHPFGDDDKHRDNIPWLVFRK